MWAGYLFPGGETGEGVIEHWATVIEREIQARIGTSHYEATYTTEGLADDYDEANISSNLHYQVRHQISNRAVLAGFLMLWLKRCLVSSPPHEIVIMDIIFPVVRLAFREPFTLVPTVVTNIQSRLKTLIVEFCVMTHGQKTPNPRMELAYIHIYI